MPRFGRHGLVLVSDAGVPRLRGARSAGEDCPGRGADSWRSSIAPQAAGSEGVRVIHRSEERSRTPRGLAQRRPLSRSRSPPRLTSRTLILALMSAARDRPLAVEPMTNLVRSRRRDPSFPGGRIASNLCGIEGRCVLAREMPGVITCHELLGASTPPSPAPRSPPGRAGAPLASRRAAPGLISTLNSDNGARIREPREARRRRDHQSTHLCRRRGGIHRAYGRRCLPRRAHSGRILHTIAYHRPTLGVSRPPLVLPSHV